MRIDSNVDWSKNDQVICDNKEQAIVLINHWIKLGLAKSATITHLKPGTFRYRLWRDKDVTVTDNLVDAIHITDLCITEILENLGEFININLVYVRKSTVVAFKCLPDSIYIYTTADTLDIPINSSQVEELLSILTNSQRNTL